MASRFLAAVAAFSALTPIAFAQDEKQPTPIMQQQNDAPVTTAAPAEPQTPAPRGSLPAPVEQQQLSQLDAWSVSALSRANGALPPDLWSHSDPAALAVVLDRLPAVYDSRASQLLAQRVLFSGGAAPAGDATLAARKRFEALGKMGAADELATMVSGAGDAQNDLGIAMFAAQAELARGRRAEACARGRNADGGATPPAFLLRLRAYCAAVTGDRAASDLALEVARSQNAADPWYTAAIAAAAGAPGARPPAARYDNSLAAQISIAGNLRPAANALNDSSTLALLAVARNDQAPQPQRAQAAALAFRRGALSANETRTILQATPATATTGLPSIVVALRQSAAAQPGSAEAIAPIANVLRAASAPADFVAAARFFRQEITNAQTAPDAASAMLFARAALLVGDINAGQRLTASARQAGADEAALAPLDAALAALAGVRNDAGGQALQRRIDNAGRNPRAAARDATILAALGAPVGGEASAFLLANPPQGGARADSGAMLSLGAAVERGAVGEGALLAVVAAGQAGPARLDAESLDRVIRALRGLGLETDARRIAAEAILAGPPPAPAAPAAPTPRR